MSCICANGARNGAEVTRPKVARFHVFSNVFALWESETARVDQCLQMFKMGTVGQLGARALRIISQLEHTTGEVGDAQTRTLQGPPETHGSKARH